MCVYIYIYLCISEKDELKLKNADVIDLLFHEILITNINLRL